MLIKDHSKVVMIGDSITDTGRDASGEATPWSTDTALGKGYVSYFDAWIQSTRPAGKIRIINRGVSGNTVRDLKSRWSPDVLELKPDWVSVMIGINDVWRQFDTPLRTNLQVGPSEYAETLEELVASTRTSVQGLILGTPYFIEGNRDDAMRKQMDAYGAIVKEIATRHNCVLVDTQAAFDVVLKDMHPMTLAWDRIHPSATGHMVLAQAFLKAIGAFTLPA